MEVLVIYGTVEGHTRKVASHIANVIEEAGHRATLTDVVQPGSFGLGNYDGAILCGPIHIGSYPAPFVHFINDWKEGLLQIPTALVTMSLAIASENPEERAEAAAFPRKLETVTGWKATMEHNAAGALKYLEYDFLRRWLMRRISEKEGGPVDTSRDHELTDWPALDAFTMRFVAAAASD